MINRIFILFPGLISQHQYNICSWIVYVFLAMVFYYQRHNDLSSGNMNVLLDFSLTVNAATLIFISGRGLTISSAKEEKSFFFIIW